MIDIDLVPMLEFAAVSLAIALSPGASWLYVISTTVRQQQQGGLVAVLGNGTGIVCHVLAAALGLSAILSYSATAYTVIKWLGAMYLVYLGIRTLRKSASSSVTSREIESRSYYRIFRDGILVNVLNPKVSLLMLALLPQFVDSASSNVAVQTVSLGMIHVLIATIVLTLLVIVTHRSAAMFRASQTCERLFRWTAGSLLIGLGARMALTSNSPN